MPQTMKHEDVVPKEFRHFDWSDSNGNRETYTADPVKICGVTFTPKCIIDPFGNGTAVYQLIADVGLESVRDPEAPLKYDQTKHAIAEAVIRGMRKEVPNVESQLRKSHFAPPGRQDLDIEFLSGDLKAQLADMHSKVMQWSREPEPFGRLEIPQDKLPVTVAVPQTTTPATRGQGADLVETVSKLAENNYRLGYKVDAQDHSAFRRGLIDQLRVLGFNIPGGPTP